MGNGADGRWVLCYSLLRSEDVPRVWKRLMGGRLLPIVVTSSVVLAGCSGISFTKAGEDDAKSACAAYAAIQGDDVSIEDGLSGMMKAEAYALAAAAANDDYEALGSASKAFSESLVVGSEDLAQSAWANVAQICSDLFEPSIWR